GERSPKADAIAELMPEAFVDDYLPYLRGVPDAVHRALVLRAPHGSPNDGPELVLAHTTHDDLAAFVDHWLAAR
ncbi:MAG: HAD family hydrolase, partial [Rubrivivax sp.]|nr:HAD family hydrolase [Rubrivivax sp.]